VIRNRKTLLDAASVSLIPLRPLSPGEILDGAFLIVRRSARRLLALPLLVIAIVAVWLTLTSFLTVLLGEYGGVGVAIVMNLLQIGLGSLLITGTVMWLAGILSRSSLLTVLGEGFAPPSSLPLRRALRWIGPMLAIAVLFGAYFGLAQLVGSTVSMVGLIMAAAFPPVDDFTLALQVIGWMLAMMFVVCWLASWISLVVPVYAAEGRLAPEWVGRGTTPVSVPMAFVRSFRLVGWRGSLRLSLVLLAMVVLLLIAAVMLYAGTFVLTLLTVYALGSIEAPVDLDLVIMVALALAGVCLTLLASLGIAYLSSLLTLSYLDQRMRREGLDLALRFPSVPVPTPGTGG
jgi:hypothetical protein